MAVYIFKMLVGFFPNGVDNAQGYRARMLKKLGCPVKYFFTEISGMDNINRYRKLGIHIDQMASVHQYLTDQHSMKLTVKVEDKLEELRESLQFTHVIRGDREISLVKDSCVIAMLLLDEGDRDYFYGIHYYSDTKLIRTEMYADGISYANYYKTARAEAGLYAKLTRRTFYNRNGSVAFDQIFEGEKEWYLFPDGRSCTKAEFIAQFIKSLNLTDKDTVLIDSAGQFEFTQPLLQYKNGARIIAVFHSGHYFEKGENPFGSYLNFEYYYWFRCSGMIDIMVVSTQEQKKELTEKLREYHCEVPRIEIIPAGGIDRLRYPKMTRRPGSLLSVSQLNERKRIDWVIRSVIRAHSINPEISLDIYGCGTKEYTQSLYDIVSQNNAQSYIRFMGHVNMTEVYKNYETFISASLRETLGLSVMEAVGSGLAVAGLDVRYGNRLFVHPGRNGYLVDFDLDYVDGDDSKLIEDMAEKVVDIFRDKDRLERFHRHSYEISQDFLQEKIEEQWKRLLL